MSLSQTERKLIAKEEGRSKFAWVHKDPQTGKTQYGYPIHDETHVRMAITMFSKHHQNIPPSERPEVARKIYRAAKRFGIEVTAPAILKYVRLDRAVKKAELLDYLARRHRRVAPFGGGPTLYSKLAEEIRHAQLNWVLVDEVLHKIAAYDEAYRIAHYNPDYEDPYTHFQNFFLDKPVLYKVAGEDTLIRVKYTQLDPVTLVTLLNLYRYE